MKSLQHEKKIRLPDAPSEDISPQLLLQSVKDAHEEILLLRGRLAEYKWLEEALRERTHELNERMKELECLYAVSSTLMNRRLSFEQKMSAVIKEMPRGWQYPKATCVRIVLDGREFTSRNFRSTDTRQTAAIHLDERAAGEVEVCVLPELTQGQPATILHEEQTLLNIIALWLGEALRENINTRKG